MLLPKNTNPAYSTYFYGGILLKCLSASDGTGIEFINLFQQFNKLRRISIQSFVLALDWLYLIGSIQLDECGMIKLVKKAHLSDSDKAIIDKMLAELSFASKLYELILSASNDLDSIPAALKEVLKKSHTESVRNVHKIS